MGRMHNAAVASRRGASEPRPPQRSAPAEASAAWKVQSRAALKSGASFLTERPPMNHPGTTLPSLTDKLVARKEGSIGWIVFNNPARHNAVSLEMWQSLTLVLRAYEQDAEVRVIVLRGEGEKAFVAGADISQFKEKRTSPEAVAHYNATADEAAEVLRNSPKPRSEERRVGKEGRGGRAAEQ